MKFLKITTLIISLIVLTSCQGPGVNGDGDRKQVTILGVMIGEQQEKIEQALAPFTEATGIEVVYEGTDTFATTLPIRVDSGLAPDLAMFPQPGLMADFAREGRLVPLGEILTPEEMTEAYDQAWLDLAAVDGTIYGVWYRASVKSLVWFNPQEFAAHGYEVPHTWEEMMALGERIIGEGKTPWCLSIESGNATGWVGTDWVEDIMLRTAGPGTYDQWVSHQIPFNAPVVRNAVNVFGEIAQNGKMIYGGKVGALSTPFGDSILGLFTDPPYCYLHRQGNFIAAFLPPDLNPEEVDVFPLPPIDPDYGLPILVGGDIFAMFNDTPEARQLMAYLASPQPHEIAATLGAYISPHKNIDLNLYPDHLTHKQAEILSNAEVIRFDASDMMPGAVGTGTFWSGMVDYIGGTDGTQVLNTIERSWPR
jgi:alpha-glucoside transport system substrate-binding protein